MISRIQLTMCLGLTLIWLFQVDQLCLLASSTPGLRHAAPRVETIAPVNLDQMAKAAGKIVIGRCLSATPQFLSREMAGRLRLPGTGRIMEYVFSIEQTLKGRKSQTIQFKQIHSLTGLNGQSLLHSMPHYEIGREYLLFLTQESEVGLCSPVGLFQGAFRLQQDKAGQVVATNGNQNVGLFPQTTPLESRLKRQLTPLEKAYSAQGKGPLPVETLILATKEILKAARNQ
ncbi:MAG: hypothetical protein HY774_18480 [Acidobacteria bacterium]|nr:hypothetical protein [Acidobacteriota bacterium]